MKRHRHPGVAVCIGAVLGLLGTGAHAQTPEEALPVVRFGVLDPPVVAQRDVTVRAMTSNHPLDPEPKLLECSGMTAIGNRLILTSDRHAHGVFLLDIDPAAATVGEPQLEIIIGNEKNLLNDLESAASLRHADGSANVYLITSLSNDPEGEADITRRRWARFAVSAEGEVVPASTRMLDVQPLRDAVEEAFSALQVRAYHAYTPDENDNTDRWGNIEGIAFAPQGGLALLGFRNPLAGGEAIFATVRGVDEAFDRGDPELIELVDLFRLDLGGRGVSDLAWDPVTRGYSDRRGTQRRAAAERGRCLPAGQPGLRVVLVVRREGRAGGDVRDRGRHEHRRDLPGRRQPADRTGFGRRRREREPRGAAKPDHALLLRRVRVSF